MGLVHGGVCVEAGVLHDAVDKVVDHDCNAVDAAEALIEAGQRLLLEWHAGFLSCVGLLIRTAMKTARQATPGPPSPRAPPWESRTRPACGTAPRPARPPRGSAPAAPVTGAPARRPCGPRRRGPPRTDTRAWGPSTSLARLRTSPNSPRTRPLRGRAGTSVRSRTDYGRVLWVDRGTGRRAP